MGISTVGLDVTPTADHDYTSKRYPFPPRLGHMGGRTEGALRWRRTVSQLRAVSAVTPTVSWISLDPYR